MCAGVLCLTVPGHDAFTVMQYARNFSPYGTVLDPSAVRPFANGLSHDSEVAGYTHPLADWKVCLAYRVRKSFEYRGKNHA